MVTPPAGHVLITFPKKDGGIQIWDEFAVRPGELVAMSRGYNCWRIIGPTRSGAVVMLADSLAEYTAGRCSAATRSCLVPTCRGGVRAVRCSPNC